MRISVFVANFFLLASLAAGQTAVDRERAASIRSATAELRQLAADREEPDSQYRKQRDTLRGTIHRTVDEFVEAATGNRSATAISDDLSTLLRDQVPNREYGDAPAARSVTTRNGAGLFVTYNVLGHHHDSSPTVRAYLRETAGYRFVAATGDDFAEGFTVRSRTIRSPLPSEAWLMVWGPKEGYNGTLVRFRLYAFDGETVRTLWAPDDMLDAEIAIRNDGFAIKHLLKDQRPWEFVRDEYILTPDGPSSVVRRNAD